MHVQLTPSWFHRGLSNVCYKWQQVFSWYVVCLCVDLILHYMKQRQLTRNRSTIVWPEGGCAELFTYLQQIHTVPWDQCVCVCVWNDLWMIHRRIKTFALTDVCLSLISFLESDTINGNFTSDYHDNKITHRPVSETGQQQHKRQSYHTHIQTYTHITCAHRTPVNRNIDNCSGTLIKINNFNQTLIIFWSVILWIR